MKSGIIKLIDKKGNVAKCGKYDCPADRNILIQKWKNLYKKGFDNCILQSAPDVDINLIDLDGTNIKVRNQHPHYF